MKLSKVIAIPAIALTAGLSLAACGSHSAVHHTHSTTQPTPNSTKPDTMIPAPGGPMIPATPAGAAGLVTAGTQYSLNWSGYATTGKETSVSSAWTVPNASCPTAQFQASAFWVGLDGLKDSTVEQDGTDSGCYGFRPLLCVVRDVPGGPAVFSNPVYPGDHFTASVSVSSRKYYTLVISDSTRKWSHTVKVTKSGLADSSAEVIAEAPSATSGILHWLTSTTLLQRGSRQCARDGRLLAYHDRNAGQWRTAQGQPVRHLRCWPEVQRVLGSFILTAGL